MTALHVVYRVGDAEYVIPAAEVVQMETWSGATPVPGSAPWVLGVAQMRGALVPVVDLRARFGLPPADEALDHRVVVVRRHDGLVGLKVDRAREVLAVDEDAFEEPPALVQRAGADAGRVGGGWVRAVVRVGERVLMDVDFDRVVEGGGFDE